MLPDALAGEISLVGTFHHLLEGFIVVAIQLSIIQALGSLLNQGIIVIGLLEVDVILPIVCVKKDKLTTDGLMDFP